MAEPGLIQNLDSALASYDESAGYYYRLPSGMSSGFGLLVRCGQVDVDTVSKDEHRHLPAL